jgi:Sec7-like guanine-nucleotide exchange factor
VSISINKGDIPDTFNADEYADVFQLALESRFPRVMEIALEGLGTLFSNGHMLGGSAVVDTGLVQNSKYKTILSSSSVREPVCVMDHIIMCIVGCCEESDEVVQARILSSLFMAARSQCEVDDESLVLIVKAFMHLYLTTRNAQVRTKARDQLLQLVDTFNMRMEGVFAGILQKHVSGSVAHKQQQQALPTPPGTADGDDTSSSSSSSGGGVTPEQSLANTLVHRKCLSLLRQLCRWTQEPAAAAEGGERDGCGGLVVSKKMSSSQSKLCKLLALDAILATLDKAGPALKNKGELMEVIRDNLCSALLETSTSHDNEVISSSLQIFVVLLEGYKDYLKTELEVFVTTIFLKTLESGYSTYDHKMAVLKVFHSICQDPRGMVEFFVNYDCSLDSEDMFVQILDGFVRIVSTTSLRGGANSSNSSSVDSLMGSNSKNKGKEDNSLLQMGLQGLVLVLRSLLANSGYATTESGALVAIEDGTAGAGGGGGSSPGGGNNNSNSKTRASISPQKASSVPGDGDNGRSSSGGGDHIPEDGEDHAPVISLASREASVEDMTGETSDALKQQHPNSAMDAFTEKRRLVEEVQTGILKFNLKPAKGLAYLVELGHLERTPAAVAQFLHQNQDRLNKAVVGDYLGKEREYENGFCLQVLNEYVNRMNFAGMEFSEAIRYFLRGFFLPGEAQKIDRIMETFAERYYIQNKDEFASADMAFILAFSTIMLQTNLHNPAIRDDKRMTREQFIKQNKGISTDGELSDEMLVGIYDRISAEPISMKDAKEEQKKRIKEEGGTFTVFQATADKRRKNAFDDERKEMMKQVKDSMIKRASVRPPPAPVTEEGSGEDGSSSAWITGLANEADFSRPMFEVAWAPILGVLSQVMETTTNQEAAELCLAGFQCAIHLACRLENGVVRGSYINALVNFTALDTVRAITPKNVLAIKLLLDITVSEGDYLDESWSLVLQCISQLARLQAAGLGQHGDGMFFRDSSSDDKDSDRLVTKFFGALSGMESTRAEADRQVEEANATMVTRELSMLNVDNVFFHSQYLSQRSVQHFVTSLCEVSVLEIGSVRSMLHSLQHNDRSQSKEGATAAVPRVFSLQKLVEVADFNMTTRSRIAWSEMWSVLAAHFTTVGMCENISLAMFAIDSLKQLSVKFLAKPELSNFNFQAIFLQPFASIMNKSQDDTVKDLILSVLNNLILGCAGNIRSGWRTIFAILSATTRQADSSSAIPDLGFEIVLRLVEQRFDLLIFDFVELMNTLTSFAACKHTALSFRALHLITVCAGYLAEGRVNDALGKQHVAADSMDLDWKKEKGAVDGSGEMSNSSNDDSFSSAGTGTGGDGSSENDPFRLWWPLLRGVSKVVADPRLDVRIRALETLQNLLCKYSELFSARYWSVIFNGILFPMMDSCRLDTSRQPVSNWPAENPHIVTVDPNSWIGTMALPVLTAFIEIYHINRGRFDSADLLAELLALLSRGSCSGTESLARISNQCFHDLVISLTNGNADDDRSDTEGSDEAPDDFFRERARSETPDQLSMASVGAGGVHALAPEVVAALVRHVCEMSSLNLCTDFGSLGRLSVSQDCPATVFDSSLCGPCPVAARGGEDRAVASSPLPAGGQHRTGSDSSSSSSGSSNGSMSPTPAQTPSQAAKGSSSDVHVITPYGDGDAISYHEADADAAKRACVKLPWGMLYTAQADAVDAARALAESARRAVEVTPITNPQSVSATTPSNLRVSVVGSGGDSSSSSSSSSSFRSTRTAIMASMVSTLGMLSSVRLVFTRFQSVLSVDQYQDLLLALELIHWHARSFNEHQLMRSSLREKKFMVFAHNPSRSPNLLEQEVDSAKHILDIAMWMYQYQPENQDRAVEWIKTYAVLVLERYMDLDDTLAGKSPLPKDIVGAYKPAVLVALQGVLACKDMAAFARVHKLLETSFPRLVLCHDRDVRAVLGQVLARTYNPK